MLIDILEMIIRLSPLDQSFIAVFARGRGRGIWLCHDINLPDLPINLCNIRVTATAPASPPPLHWQ